MDPNNQQDQSSQTEQPAVISAPQQPHEMITPHTVYAQHKRKRLIIAVLTVIILIATAVAVWFFFIKKDNTQNKQSQAPANNQPVAPVAESTENMSPELAKFIKSTTGETWSTDPKELPKQGYYNDQYTEADTTYYEVGKRGDNVIIMAATVMLGDNINLFEKTPTGAVTYIARPDSQATYNQEDESNTVKSLKSTVTLNTTTSYDSLSIPRNLTLDKGYALSKPTYVTLGQRLSNEKDLTADQRPSRQTVKEYGGSKLSRAERKYADTQLTSIGYTIITPFKTEIPLTYQAITSDASKYQWSSGSNYAAGQYKPITRGCGSITTSATRGDNIKDTDVVEAGKSQDGSAVFEFKDPNFLVVSKAYDEFKEYAGTDSTVPNANITKDDFIKQHGIVAHKDKYNQWLVFVNENYAPVAGCAKPVVYLYPTQATNVNVKVGADVKISEPLYNPNSGWNAFARPNGQLNVEGKPYESLFWEGPGYGEYPAITSGTVVARDQALATIKAQLAAQGLNAKESADFIDYWHDKLPNKPYIRLTWLNTAQLDQLAPLKITPKPQTSIRVFLDMAGLDRQINLPAQKFTAPKRDGFTVVEWGGLAGHKLY